MANYHSVNDEFLLRPPGSGGSGDKRFTPSLTASRGVSRLRVHGYATNAVGDYSDNGQGRFRAPAPGFGVDGSPCSAPESTSAIQQVRQLLWRPRASGMRADRLGRRGTPGAP